DNTLCASACGLAWLGGRVRYMGATARIGFHAAYTSQGGQASVSSAGNAITGAYLNQLGLPMSAIVYITGAAPDDMKWLSFSDAQRYGIDVKPFEAPASKTAVSGEPKSTAPRAKEAKVPPS